MISTSITIRDIIVAASSIVVVAILAVDGRPGVAAALIGGRYPLAVKPLGLTQKIGQVQTAETIGRRLRPSCQPLALALPARARARSDSASPIL